MPKFYVKTPVLNSYLYDICYNLPTEIIKSLPLKYRKILRTDVATKNFCEKSTIDEKLHFFHYIGLKNALTIFPETLRGKNQIKEFFKKYDDEKLASAQKDHAVLNIYVSTDKETSHLMGLMAQTISGSGFILNLDYNKTAYHLKNWDKKLNTTEANEVTETVNSGDLAAKTLLNSMLAASKADMLFGVHENDIKMLFYLFQKRSFYVSKDELWEFFMTGISKAKVTSSIKRLLFNEYIRKHIDWQNPKYSIDSKGINLVYDVMKYIMKQNNFY